MFEVPRRDPPDRAGTWKIAPAANIGAKLYRTSFKRQPCRLIVFFAGNGDPLYRHFAESGPLLHPRGWRALSSNCLPNSADQIWPIISDRLLRSSVEEAWALACCTLGIRSLIGVVSGGPESDRELGAMRVVAESRLSDRWPRARWRGSGGPRAVPVVAPRAACLPRLLRDVAGTVRLVRRRARAHRWRVAVDFYRKASGGVIGLQPFTSTPPVARFHRSAQARMHWDSQKQLRRAALCRLHRPSESMEGGACSL